MKNKWNNYKGLCKECLLRIIILIIKTIDHNLLFIFVLKLIYRVEILSLLIGNRISMRIRLYNFRLVKLIHKLRKVKINKLCK